MSLIWLLNSQNIINPFKVMVQKLNMTIHFQVEKQFNIFSHVLNPVVVNGGGGSRTHDAQVTRRTLYECSYGGNDEIKGCDLLSHQAHNFHAVTSSFSTDFKHHTQTLHKSVKHELQGSSLSRIKPHILSSSRIDSIVLNVSSLSLVLNGNCLKLVNFIDQELTYFRVIVSQPALHSL